MMTFPNPKHLTHQVVQAVICQPLDPHKAQKWSENEHWTCPACSRHAAGAEEVARECHRDGHRDGRRLRAGMARAPHSLAATPSGMSTRPAPRVSAANLGRDGAAERAPRRRGLPAGEGGAQTKR